MQRKWTDTALVASAARDPQPGGVWYRDRRRWALIAFELLATAGFMAIYFAARGLRPDSVEASVGRSLQIIQFEQQLGIFQEVAWQQMFISNGWLMHAANLIYAWLHYPVMLVVALWLVVKDPVRFRFIRNVLIVSALIGIASYWLLPAAPPRLMEIHGYDFGFIDTVHGTDSSVDYFQPGPFVNDYAAVPSFHFGWIALSSAAIWVNTQSRSIRMGAVVMSLVMWWAVTVTGNHYFFDMAMGGVVVLFSWLLVSALQRRSERRAEVIEVPATDPVITPPVTYPAVPDPD